MFYLFDLASTGNIFDIIDREFDKRDITKMIPFQQEYITVVYCMNTNRRWYSAETNRTTLCYQLSATSILYSPLHFNSLSV